MSKDIHAAKNIITLLYVLDIIEWKVYINFSEVAWIKNFSKKEKV